MTDNDFVNDHHQVCVCLITAEIVIMESGLTCCREPERTRTIIEIVKRLTPFIATTVGSGRLRPDSSSSKDSPSY